MRSLTEVADFLSKRPDAFGTTFQVFDLSQAAPMLDEMHRQYDAAGQWSFQTPLPADRCIFWDGSAAMYADQQNGKVSAVLLDGIACAELNAECDGKSKALLDIIREDPRHRPMMERKLGKEKAAEIIADAESRVASKPYDIDAEIERCEIGESPEGAMVRCVAVWSEFCGFPIADIRDAPVPRPTRRRLARLGVEMHLRTVSLSPARHKAKEAVHSPGERKALHYCRGHWRKSTSARAQLVQGVPRVWIHGHWKGDPDKGIVLHDYVAKIEDMDARAALIA